MTVRRSGGFTLLEVLMVITLLAVLMAAAFGGIRTSIKAIDSGEALIDEVNRLRVTQEFIRHELSRALPLPFGQEKGTGINFVFQGERDFMRFVAPMPGYLSRGGAYVQTLELAGTRGGSQLLFTHRMLNGFDLDRLSKDDVKPVTLLEHLRGGRFRYRGYDDEGKLGDWQDDWKDPSKMPVMVRIELDPASGSRVDWPLMEVPLIVDAAAIVNAGFMPREPLQ